MVNIGNNLSLAYKNLIGIIFKIIYGKVYFLNNQNYSTKIKLYQIRDPKISYSKKKRYLIYKIKNGRISTDYVENVAIIDENRIIDKISYQQIKGNLRSAKYNSAIKKGTPYIKKKFRGRVLSLTQGASGHSNYFHWLFDILPKIKLYSEKFDFKDLDFFYTSKLLNYQKKTLDLLGLDSIKIIDSSKYRHITSNEIIVTQHPWYHKGYIMNEVYKIPPWTINWIKTKFLPYKKNFYCNDKIFIDRSESKFNHCQIQNNREVISFLKDKGFSSYKVGQLSFEKQIYLFNNAKIIIGAHGAAFANLAFSRPNTKVIEFKPVWHKNLVNKKISKVNSLNYKLINTPLIKKNLSSKGDIYLDIKKLNKII